MIQSLRYIAFLRHITHHQRVKTQVFGLKGKHHFCYIALQLAVEHGESSRIGFVAVFIYIKRAAHRQIVLRHAIFCQCGVDLTFLTDLVIHKFQTVFRKRLVVFLIEEIVVVGIGQDHTGE